MKMEHRSGTTLLYQAQPGETLKLLPDGRVLIAHPERPLSVRRASGAIERVTPESDPDIWPIYESVLKQLLNPN